jgi:cell division protein FtsL
MTTMTRALPEKSPIAKPAGLLIVKPSFGTLLLALIVLLSGLSVIYVADLNRRLFMELQATEGTQTQLRIEWGKLLLEQSTWSTQARVQNIAQQRLGMQTPGANQIVMLKSES